MRARETDPTDTLHCADRAEQALLSVDSPSKTPVLLDLLDEEKGSVLVFTRTKHRADRLSKQLVNAGHDADRIHGDRSQGQRERALDGFRTGRVRGYCIWAHSPYVVAAAAAGQLRPRRCVLRFWRAVE